MQEYNICYSLDSNYIEQLLVSMASVLKNAEQSEVINFYILQNQLKLEDKKSIEDLKIIRNFNIEYVKVRELDFKSCPLLKSKDKTLRSARA